MDDFERLVLSGEPRERGRRHGEAFAGAVADNVECYQRKFTYEGVDLEAAREQAVDYLDVIEAEVPAYAEEMRGIADGSGVALAEIALLNVRWEVIYPAWGTSEEDGERSSTEAGVPADGCTSVGVTPPATADGRTYVGQNWDWLASVADNLLLVERRREDGPDSLAMTEAGIVGGKIGLNEAGIGLCVNGLMSAADGENPYQLPYHARFYQLLAADRFDEALCAILEGDRVGSANVLVGDVDGEVIDLEASPHRVEAIYPEDGLLTHGNHFESDAAESAGLAEVASSLYRAPRLRKLLAAERGAIDPATIQDALQDHFGQPASICKHVDTSLPELEYGQTNASFVLDLAGRRLLATRGPPCRSEYREYTL